MNEAGYDTLHALSEINEEKIKEIENFLTSNIQLVKNLTCCRSDYYNQLQIFQFLPGHKAMIMALPEQIRQIMTKKNKRKHIHEHESNDGNAPHEPKNSKYAERNHSDDELKAHLVNNLLEYLRKDVEYAGDDMDYDMQES